VINDDTVRLSIYHVFDLLSIHELMKPWNFIRVAAVYHRIC